MYHPFVYIAICAEWSVQGDPERWSIVMWHCSVERSTRSSYAYPDVL